MTARLVTRLIALWVRLYTLGLPAAVRERRAGELAADLHEQLAHERAGGIPGWRTALHLLSRAVRGAAADVSWRGAHARAAGARADRSLLLILLVTTGLLAVPLAGTLLTGGWAWGVLDFLLAGTLIAGTGLLLRALARRAGDLTSRVAAAIALAAGFGLVWGNLAVGVVGDPGGWADAAYFGVPLIAIAGAIGSRLRPAGVSRALLAAAGAQVLLTAVVLLAGAHEGTGTSAGELLALNGAFTTMFALSAALFRRVASRRGDTGAAVAGGV